MAKELQPSLRTGCGQINAKAEAEEVVEEAGAASELVFCGRGEGEVKQEPHLPSWFFRNV